MSNWEFVSADCKYRPEHHAYDVRVVERYTDPETGEKEEYITLAATVTDRDAFVKYTNKVLKIFDEEMSN